MAESKSRLKELFLNKPEFVINLPGWLLPTKKINEYRSMSNLAIVEIAGRDSVAAAIKGAEEGGFTDLLPTYVYTGTEHGPWSSLAAAVGRLAERLPEIKIHDFIVIGSPNFWRALNGRYISELIDNYRFYTPCVGCHLYLHSVRIPIALTLGKIPIISGERESHNGDIKINQIPEALDGYQRLSEDFEMKLIFPLRHISKGDRIEEILGFHWEEGKDQLGCVLSGNYRKVKRNDSVDKEDLVKYLNEFAIPCSKRIIEYYIAGQIPNHEEIGAQVFAKI
jgi:hypothetical protein